MLAPLADLDHEAILELLAVEYGRPAGRLEFAPLGEDSWCYRAGGSWVSVRRDLRGHFPRAYGAATELREAGLEFVLAPLRGASGDVVHVVDRLPVVVFPYVESVSLDRADPTVTERREALEILARLHRATLSQELSSESFDLPFADELSLVGLIAAGEVEPAGGPYADQLGILLREHRAGILEWRTEYEELSTQFREGGFEPRPTHGEPLASNFLRTARGLMLADWGELMVAPAERDWVHLERTLDVRAQGDPRLSRLYDLRWRLSEVSEYATVFSDRHAGGDDDAAMWERLTRYLPSSRAAVAGAVGR